MALACVLSCASSAQLPLASNVEATTVPIATPSAIAYDAAGDLYIALVNDHVVRKVDTNGIITTVAGTGVQGFAGDGGAATSALLDSPAGVAVDASGNLYIADSHNQCIREVVNGTITTIAGTPRVAGFSGDAGAATAAQLDLPTAISIDSAGNLYIADTNNQRIRKITGGIITTVAGIGVQGFAGDGGAATSAMLDTPTGVAADPSNAGQFYIGDTHNQRVRLVNLAGNISTIAGTGVPSFGGDGGAATSAELATPRGLAVDATGDVYLADADNERIREIVNGNISTVAGDGVQGFAGDVGTALSAELDTPRSAAVNASGGGIGLADTHNQRVRSVVSGIINTVAGIAPPLTEGLLLNGPTSGSYGTAIGILTAVFSNGSNSATGSVVLSDSGMAIATAPLSGNAASFNLSSLSGGLHLLAVSYGGDAQNPPIASGLYLVNVLLASQAITFPALPTPVVYAPGLTATLAATASSGLPVTYSVTGPATVSGSTLTYTGPGTVVVTAMQAGNVDYLAAAPAGQSVTVLQALVASSVTPSTAPLGTVNLPISVTGSGFTSTSVIRLNGTALPSTFVSTSSLTAVIPQLLTLGAVSVTVYDTASLEQSAPVILTVTPPTASATLSAPTTSTSDQQPSVSLQLQTAYPEPITGTFTLTFAPYGTLVDDPAIQFSTGTRSFSFTIPANSTTVPAVALQTGTVAGAITVDLSLIVAGVDVTPAAARSVTITVPPQVPGAAVTFTQSGATVTVSVVGFSNVRDMTQANFNFTAAPGTSLSTTSLSVPVTGVFTTWFDSAASDAYGSEFLYTQTFNLSDSTSQVQAISVTLTNSVGSSSPATTP